MTHKVRIPGYEFKDGKIVRKKSYLDVSAKLRQKGSKKVRVVRRGGLVPS